MRWGDVFSEVVGALLHCLRRALDLRCNPRPRSLGHLGVAPVRLPDHVVLLRTPQTLVGPLAASVAGVALVALVAVADGLFGPAEPPGEPRERAVSPESFGVRR